MRIYLDCCALNRPYDDLTQMTVTLEHRQSFTSNFGFIAENTILYPLKC